MLVVCWSAAKQKSQFFKDFSAHLRNVFHLKGVVVKCATCILEYVSLCSFKFMFFSRLCCW